MQKNKKTKGIKTLLILSTILATFNTQNVQAIDEDAEEENQESIHTKLVKEDYSTIENDNLVRNGDFTKLLSDSLSPWTGDTPEDWDLWIPADIDAKEYITEINDNGQLVLSSLEETFRAAVNQNLEIDSTKTYQLSFDIQTIGKEGLARIRIMEKNDDEQLNLWYSNNFHGDTDL